MFIFFSLTEAFGLVLPVPGLSTYCLSTRSVSIAEPGVWTSCCTSVTESRFDRKFAAVWLLSDKRCTSAWLPFDNLFVCLGSGRNFSIIFSRQEEYVQRELRYNGMRSFNLKRNANVMSLKRH